MKISIPYYFRQEGEYIVDVLFNQFLGLRYEIALSKNLDDVTIELGDKQIVLKNHFWKRSELNYKIENLPIHIFDLKYEEVNFTCLYGSTEIEVSNKSTIVNADVLASAFFMLTRWEEDIVEARDKHARFQGVEACAVKYGFITRPVVNEYVEFLWKLLLKNGISQQRKEQIFTVLPTHDVDFPYFNKGVLKTAYKSLWYLLKGYNMQASELWKYYNGTDPYDNHELFLDDATKSEKKAHFFFMAGGDHTLDGDYSIESPKIKRLVRTVIDAGHEVGLHPSYNAYNNSMQFQKEKIALQEVAKKEISFGRQHYLRFSVPDTWKIWEENNMQWDSSMGYAGFPGFRTGTCYEHTVFNYKEKEHYKLKEKPLNLMEVTLKQYLEYSPEKSIEKVDEIFNQCKKYDGNFVYLWHNSSFNLNGWDSYRKVYNHMNELN